MKKPNRNHRGSKILAYQVQDYRSLKSVRVELNDLTVFVGRNGSGKSNLVDVLHFTIHMLRENLDYAILIARNGMESLVRSSPGTRRFSATFELDLDLSDFGMSNSNKINYSFTIGGTRKGEYRFTAERLAYAEGNRTISSRRGQARTRHGIHRANFRMPPTTSIVARPFDEESYSLQTFLTSSEKYNIYPDSLRIPQRSANDKVLLSNGENLASILKNLQDNRPKILAEIITILNQINPEIVGLSVETVAGYRTVVFQHYNGEKFGLHGESDGTLRALALLTALYYSDNPRIIIIEEPELGIHPGASRVLAEAIVEASRRHQIIVTTHDPLMLNYFAPESIRIVTTCNNETSVSRLPLECINLVRDDLASIGQLLTSGSLDAIADSLRS